MTCNKCNKLAHSWAVLIIRELLNWSKVLKSCRQLIWMTMTYRSTVWYFDPGWFPVETIQHVYTYFSSSSLFLRPHLSCYSIASWIAWARRCLRKITNTVARERLRCEGFQSFRWELTFKVFRLRMIHTFINLGPLWFLAQLNIVIIQF